MTSHPIRTVIVDDEPVARELIRIRLEREPDFEIVGEAASGPEAVAAVARELPHLLFLDIQMPGMTGFQALDAMASNHLPHVVFVTAFDQFALRAFDAHAIDYLVKPVDQARWLRALGRTRAIVRSDSDEQRLHLASLLSNLREEETQMTGVQRRHASSEGSAAAARIKRFVVKESDRIFLVPVSQADWIESSGNYVVLHARGSAYRLRTTMASLERDLDPDQFTRIHRRIIVNLDRIAGIQPSYHGDFDVTLSDGTRVRMSREYRSRVIP
ncbi:MAG: response regulator [Gemmatimonadaceae bacterium]